MSLTFRNVPKISRKQGRSRKWARRQYQAIHINECLDDFPPLTRVTAEKNYSVYNHNFFPIYDQEFCLNPHRQTDIITHRELSNWQFLDRNPDKSFEEVRWNDYHRRDTSSGKSYSQCLIKNKFCCQKNQNPYTSKPDVSMMANRSVINILGGFKEKLSEEKNNFDRKRDIQAISVDNFMAKKEYPVITSFQSNVSFNSRSPTPVLEIIPPPNSTTTYELPVKQNLSDISSVQLTNRLNESESLSSSYIPSSSSFISVSVSPMNMQKQTSPISLVQKNLLSDFRSNVITQKSILNLNMNTRPTRSKSISSFGLLETNVNNVTTKPLLNDNVHTKLLPKISEESSITGIKPFKTRSIHTINEPIKPTPIFQAPVNQTITPNIYFNNESPIQNIQGTGIMYQHHQASQQYLLPKEQQSLFPNTTWFLQENLSNQFGFSQLFNTVQPIFEEGNLYAEYFDYPTIPTPKADETNSIVGRKKNFRSLFSPYEKENRAMEKYHIYNCLC